MFSQYSSIYNIVYIILGVLTVVTRGCGVSVQFTAGHKKVVPMRTHRNPPSIVNTKALRTGAAHHPGEVVVFSCSNH